MGQSVTVVEKRSSNPEVLRFEINRSLTGMGHERYSSLDDIVLARPVDVLARRLFETGGVDAVHVNSSIITVDLAGGSTGEGLLDVIQNLFRFYGDEVPAAEAEAEGVPVDEVAEPEVAQAPEVAADEAVERAATAAEADDAPHGVDTSSAVE